MARLLHCIVALLWLFGTREITGFVRLQPSTRNLKCAASCRQNALFHCRLPGKQQQFIASRRTNKKSASALSMGYSLPPGRGGGGGGLNEILSSVATIALVVAFFMSPLGGIFFALFNSFLAFIFLAPAVLFVGFQVWQYFNTVEGACPSCGAPLRVMKDQNQPSICLNCGAFVAANGSGGIGFAGGGGGGGMSSSEDIITEKEEEAGSIFSDFFDNSWGAKRAPTKPPPGARKDLDVIDAEIEDEDKPFM